MKRILSVLFLMVILSGCSNGDENIKGALSLRESVITAKSCSFTTTITADYQSEFYNFKLQCATDDNGNVRFSVIQPDSIAGITGEVSNEGGKLTFDDKYLVFAPLADGLLTPVSAPWLFIKALKSGYISGCSKEEGGTKILINDTYQDSPLDISVVTDRENNPCNVEIFWQGRCVLAMTVENFTIL